jgi:hypothetical protein
LPEWAPEAARAELARRWLYAYRPTPVTNLRWWTGWTAGQAKKAFAGLAPVEVDLDGVTGLVLPCDVEPVEAPEPWVAMLPASIRRRWGGWSEASISARIRRRCSTAPANIGPTIWCDGRIVGLWAQRGDGEVAYRLLEDVGADAESVIEVEADRLAGWFGGVRVTPRFRPSLERALSS